MRSNLEHGDIICDLTDKFLSNLIYSRKPNLFNKSLCQGSSIHPQELFIRTKWMIFLSSSHRYNQSILKRKSWKKSDIKSTEYLQKTTKYFRERKNVSKSLSSFWSYANWTKQISIFTILSQSCSYFLLPMAESSASCKINLSRFYSIYNIHKQ